MMTTMAPPVGERTSSPASPSSLPPLPLQSPFSFRRILTVILLVADIVATVLFWRIASRAEWAAHETRFHTEARSVQRNIAKRMTDHELILLSGAGLRRSSENVTRDEWARYISTLRLEENFPGIQGVGFARWVPRDQIEAVTRSVRAEGFPDFSVKPPGDRPEYAPILHLEPFTGRNLLAFGYDMWSEPVRREAMARARDQGQVSISGPVRLVQETVDDVQTGFLMYVPVYRKGLPTATPAERRAALTGFVYSPFRTRDLMTGILKSRYPNLEVIVLDIAPTGEQSPLYAADDPNHVHEHPPLLERDFRLDLYGRTWLVRIHSTPAFDAALDQTQSRTVLLLGLGLTGLILLHIVHDARTLMRVNRLVLDRTSALERENERARALEKDLRISEERWRTAVDSAGDGLWDWNVPGNKIFFSSGWKRMLGHADDEVGDGLEEWSSRVHPEDLDRAMADVQRHLRGESAWYENEHRMRCKDGSWKWILDRGRVIERDAAGNPVRVIGTHTDVTGRKKAEHDYQELEKRAARAEKSAAISRLGGGVAHEINNVLCAIGLDSQRLRMTLEDLGVAGPEAPAITERLDAIDSGIKRGAHIVSAIRSLRLGGSASEQGPFPVEPLVTRLLASRAPGLDAQRIEVEARLAPGAWAIGVVPEIEQVVLNLLINAEHAMVPTGGGRLTVSAEVTNGVVTIAITDTGIGMTDEVREQAQLPFFTTKGAYAADQHNLPGTGLGLAVCTRIIEEHGGTLSLESYPGAGTTVTFTLPATSPPSEDGRVADRPGDGVEAVEESRNRSRRILIVDDDEAMARSLAAFLARRYPETTFTASGKAALELVAKDRPDVVITDYIMPDMRGDALRKSLPREVAVILVTGWIEFRTDEERARVFFGFDRVIQKPYSLREIGSAVDELFESSR